VTGATRLSRNERDQELDCCSPIPEGKKRMIACVSILAGILLLGWLIDREILIQTAARLWVTSDPVQPADAVAIFGGGIETRPSAAAEYFRQGLVRKIVVSNVDSGAELQSSQSHTSRNLAELKKLGVPDDAIDTFGCKSSTTYQEALALRHWSLSNGAHTLVIPTEYFSSRRVRWVAQKVFLGTGVQVQVPAIASLDYLRGQWWDNADALLAFQREVAKYVGYRLMYLHVPAYQPRQHLLQCEN
jgi:uncharacterized SAM-binding protein YcdF (DUF218 family)